jgi:tetraacyldisaccharide 4'-kinase
MSRTALLPLAALYGAVMFLRNRAFDWGILPTSRVEVPVIAVGNLAAGGTGKTPLVEFLVGYLLKLGRRVAVVSRGYGRSSRGVVVVSEGNGAMVDARTGGDEAVQVARKFPAAAVVVGERRIDAARKAVEDLKADVLVLDDAFQHRWIDRQLNILVLDAGSDIRTEAMLPAGTRREPLAGIGRADMIAWSRTTPASLRTDLQRAVAPWFNGPLLMFRSEPAALRRADGFAGSGCMGKKVLAVSGIANPCRFFDALKGLGAQVVSELVFPDHHAFRRGDISKILEIFRKVHADLIVTTEKDWVRATADDLIRRNFLAAYPVWYLPITVTIVEGEEMLDETVRQTMERFHRA